MELYDDFDYLCNEPYFIPNIGTIINPTLRDIRKLTHRIFSLYANICAISVTDYLEQCKLKEEFDKLPPKEKENYNLFTLMLYTDFELLFKVIAFFIKEDVEFRGEDLSFHIYAKEINSNRENIKEEIGIINTDNFDTFRNEVLKILGLKQIEKPLQKFKNNTAKKIFEKLKKHSQDQKKKQDENYSLDNMIKKYCTHNKVGINILNVWDMTYCQFMSMFSEYCNGRQYDFNDMMAANTFSYKKPTDYKPLDYMKKLNNN